eukprot:Amastigsp_a175477_8.p2 type:complete len:128 gc:universal Amastigsp_a175477_8:1029-646(-)
MCRRLGGGPERQRRLLRAKPKRAARAVTTAKLGGACRGLSRWARRTRFTRSRAATWTSTGTRATLWAKSTRTTSARRIASSATSLCRLSRSTTTRAHTTVCSCSSATRTSVSLCRTPSSGRSRSKSF